MTWSRATAIAGSAVVTLASCRIRSGVQSGSRRFLQRHRNGSRPAGGGAGVSTLPHGVGARGLKQSQARFGLAEVSRRSATSQPAPSRSRKISLSGCVASAGGMQSAGEDRNAPQDFLLGQSLLAVRTSAVALPLAHRRPDRRRFRLLREQARRWPTLLPGARPRSLSAGHPHPRARGPRAALPRL